MSKQNSKNKRNTNNTKKTNNTTNTTTNTKNTKLKIGIIAGIVAVILAITGLCIWMNYPKILYKTGKTDHFQAHVTLNVDGNPYTPKNEDVLGADRFTINEDGSVDYMIDAGVNDTRDITIAVDGLENPLTLRTFITDEKYRVKLNLNADVDTEAKKAIVTGELKTNDDPAFRGKVPAETWSIYRELDLTVAPENTDKIGGTY